MKETRRGLLPSITCSAVLAGSFFLATACRHPERTEPLPDPASARPAETTGASGPAASSLPPPPTLPAAPTPGPAHFVETLDVSEFQRGNLHSHTSRSDGDRPPEETYAWYRDHGYAFVAITDHNQRSAPEEFRSLERKGFAMIPGEEITMLVHGHPVHVNAICTAKTIGDVADHMLENFPTIDEALRWAVSRVREQGGVALVNHPNFIWALTADDLPSAHGAQLLEIWSGHPFVHCDGDAQHPSEETIWDRVLKKGETFAGVAVDDTHYIGPHRDPAAKPGRGWVEVFASEATAPAICAALAQGHLYASSGVRLRRIAVGGDTLSLWPERPGVLVEFVGEGAEILSRARPAKGEPATYRLHGRERYVRARATLPDGKHAWTQAYRVVPEVQP